MKKLIYLLLLPLVVAVTACGGKVNSKKESVLATQDSVDARGIQRMQTSKSVPGRKARIFYTFIINIRYYVRK